MDGKKQTLATLLCAGAIVVSLNVVAYAYNRGPSDCTARAAANPTSATAWLSSTCKQREPFFEW
jgi:hypothetical protein